MFAGIRERQCALLIPQVYHSIHEEAALLNEE
jgi:hypothetical protein